jgi:hypothetical protein
MRNPKILRACTYLALGLMLALLQGCAIHQAQDLDSLRDARALENFNNRTQDYLGIHHQAEQKWGLTEHLKAVLSADQILNRQRAMARHIAALRKDTGEGAIFTPETKTYFARNLDLAYRENPAAVSASLACAAKPQEQKIRANGVYPETWDFPMMAPTILRRLPSLPPELEYRIVNQDLILRDVEANLVVDVMRDAVAAFPQGKECDD